MQFNKRWTKVDIYYSGERNEKGKEGRERKTCQISICPFSTIPWLCGVAACCWAWHGFPSLIVFYVFCRMKPLSLQLLLWTGGFIIYLFYFIFFLIFSFFSLFFLFFPHFFFFLIEWFIHSLKDIIWWRHWFLNNYQMKGLWLWPHHSLSHSLSFPFDHLFYFAWVY